MSARQSTPMSDHSNPDKVRKRVCKACDRCRSKKTKCDGLSPCSRCRADNAVCCFGHRKKTHAKVYPKGYAEMLEQQQAWLVHGLQELYRRATKGEGWPGEPLNLESNGHPLTHDLLASIGVLDHSRGEWFEDHPDYVPRQNSFDKGREPHSPITHSSFAPDDISVHSMPPTPPPYNDSPSTLTSIKTEPEAQNSQYDLAGPRVLSSLAFEGTQQWPTDGFSIFDDMDMMISTDYSNLFFDGQFSNEDSCLFVDTNPMEMSLI